MANRLINFAGIGSAAIAAAAPMLRGPKNPPTIRQVSTIRRVIRYTAPTGCAVGTAYTIYDLLNTFFTGINTTSAARLFAAARLHRVSVWGYVDAAGQPTATVSVCWNDQSTVVADEFGMPAVPLVDTVVNQFDTPVIHTRPPANTPAAMWQSGTTASNILFGITCPAGSIIDIEIEGMIALGLGGNVAVSTPQFVFGRALAGLSAGTLYTSKVCNGALVPVVGSSA